MDSGVYYNDSTRRVENAIDSGRTRRVDVLFSSQRALAVEY